MDQSPRIEAVLQVIKYMREPHTVNEIAAKMNTTYRSVYRYIDAFNAAGFPVIKNGKTYCLSKHSKVLREFSDLLSFSDEEAYIIDRAIDSVCDTNSLKLNLKKKLATIYDCINMPEIVTKGKMTGIVSALSDAIREKKQVILCDYASGHSKTKRDRHVEPFGFTTNFQDVWAFDIEDGANKLFKCSRIGSVEIGEAWQNGISHQQGYIDVFRFAGFDQLPIKLRLGVTAYNLLTEEFPLAEKFITKEGKDKWILETGLCSYVGACRFYMGLADDIEIVDSPEFQSFVDDFKQKYLVK